MDGWILVGRNMLAWSGVVVMCTNICSSRLSDWSVLYCVALREKEHFKSMSVRVSNPLPGSAKVEQKEGCQNT